MNQQHTAEKILIENFNGQLEDNSITHDCLNDESHKLKANYSFEHKKSFCQLCGAAYSDYDILNFGLEANVGDVLGVENDCIPARFSCKDNDGDDNTQPESNDDLIDHSILESADILSLFEQDLKKIGFAGDTKNSKIIYLALVSRVFDRPISLIVKGQSSSGKSYLVESVLKFFPDHAYKVLSACSEKSLIYSKECFKNKIIVICEASGMKSDFFSYILRTILSEGEINYETVLKTKNGMEHITLKKEGPIGVITTTTWTNIHYENETRMFSIDVNDTTEQTQEILGTLADAELGIVVTKDEIYEKWKQFNAWLEENKIDVIVPYAKELASLINPVATRLRRDFTLILNMIKSHALLHMNHRKKIINGNKEYIVASLEDYAIVLELVKEYISYAVGASVKKTVQETVKAVNELIEEQINPFGSGSPGLQWTEGDDSHHDYNKEEAYTTIKALSKKLNLDESTTRRRVHDSMKLGYLDNIARKGQKLKITLGEDLPNERKIFPTHEELLEIMQSGEEIEGVE